MGFQYLVAKTKSQSVSELFEKKLAGPRRCPANLVGSLEARKASNRPSLLITGASGYIGRRLIERALENGCTVHVLGSIGANGGAVRVFKWRLGEIPSAESFEGIDAVIHLAHSSASDFTERALPANTNICGSEKLARAALASGVPRFVFASTTSARADALNVYGNVKFEIEHRFRTLPGFVSARIGLVYGGPELGLYGLLSKLVRLTPIIPMVGIRQQVQPIHVDEVCTGLIKLALDALPAVQPAGSRTAFVLAGPKPMLFGDWLKLLRRAHTGRRLLLFPLPLGAVLFGCNLTRMLPFIPTIDRERVLGLVGTVPMDSATDLDVLDIRVENPIKRLSTLRGERRRLLAEARCLLCYVSGESTPSKAAVARLVRGLDRLESQSLGLPGLFVNYPALVRLVEPIKPSSSHRLGQRIHLAAMVHESASGIVRSPPTLLELVRQGMLELLVIPMRLLLGRLYA